MRLFRLKRPHTLLSVWLGLMVLLVGCSWGRDTRSAQATEHAVINAAREVMTLAARAIGGSELQAAASWGTCMGGVGQHYDGRGVIKAPKGEVSYQLAAIRSAVVGAGFTDITQVEGMVTVKRDDITTNLQYNSVYKGWRVSFRSECHNYRGVEKQRVMSGAEEDIEILTP